MNTLVNNHSTRWAPSLRIAFIEWIRLIGLIALFLISLNVQAQAEEIIFYHYDSTNSPVAATDMNGNVVWQERREPFGAPKLNQPEKQNHSVDYTGHVYDKRLGLMYMGRRFYDPKIGRFISADPIGFTPNNVQSFNRYAYANNNPYKYWDPDGRLPFLIGAGAYAAFEFGSTLYDWWNAGSTIADPNASHLDKGFAAGGVLFGMVAPGPGSLYAGAGKQGLKNVVDRSVNSTSPT